MLILYSSRGCPSCGSGGDGLSPAKSELSKTPELAEGARVCGPALCGGLNMVPVLKASPSQSQTT